MSEKLNVGDRVERVMVVAKVVRRDFSGGNFLLFQFSDRDGILKGVCWDPPSTGVNANDVVRVSGEIQDYQGALQLKVNKLEKLDDEDFDPSIFLPSSDRDMDEIYAFLMGTIESMGNPHIKGLLHSIFSDDSFRKRFLKAPAAKGWHHSYIGGLAEHVHDMLRLAERAADVYVEADRDLLYAGVMLHDLGKLGELSVTNHIDYSDKGRLLGHISIGSGLLDDYIGRSEDFPPEIHLQLKHMILSHHGQLEHGSPVRPMTLESLLLSYIDNMDAQVRGAAMVIERSGGESRWTDYVKLLDRFLYKGVVKQEKPGDEEEPDG